ncbi:magnesium/cobalt transporter CorA [Patescibacteria group bacterium]|nr:magnesium/cobalt transporter CorA [Patescibacteria group bacterium]
MSRTTIEYNGLEWTNITQPFEKDTKYLKSKYGFHSFDLRDCLSVTESPKLDIYDDYLFIVFHFPDYDPKEQRMIYRRLNVFIGDSFLVTLHKGEFDAVEGMINYMKKNSEAKDQFMNRSPGFLLYNLINPIFKKAFSLVDKIGENLREIEEDIYSDKTIDVVKELAMERRNILNFRRIVEPQRFLIDTLVHLKRKFLGTESDIYFDDIHDHIERIWMLLENYREIVRGLSDTNEALISHKINEVMKVLTVISVSLLPLTLIASIYGMNVAGLPFAGSPGALWGIMGLMISLIVGTVFYFQKRGLL